MATPPWPGGRRSSGAISGTGRVFIKETVKRPKRIVIGGTVAGLLAAVYLSQPGTEDVPVHRGFPITHWVAHVHQANAEDESIHAVLEFGPEAVPWLVREFQKLRSPLRRAFFQVKAWAFRQPSPQTFVDLSRSAALAYALGSFGPAAGEAVSVLRQAVFDRDLGVRVQSIQALGNIGQPAKEAAPALIKSLTDGDPTVRWAAARALFGVGCQDHRAVPLLVTLFTETNELTQLHAAAALWRIEPAPSRFSALTNFLGRSATQGAAIRLLGQMGSNAAGVIPDLVALLHHESLLVRKLAAEALEKIDQEAARKARTNEILARAFDDELAQVVSHLESAEPQQRGRAIAVLRRLGPKARKAVPVLIERIQDRDDAMRLEALETLLAVTRDQDIVAPVLMRCLEDADTPMRLKALDLAELLADSEPLLASLVERRNDRRVDVRLKTMLVLSELGPSANAAVPFLREAARHTNETIRRSAQQALTNITHGSPKLKALD